MSRHGEFGLRKARHQPRRHFDEDALNDLAASIAARGLLQPIVVRPQGAGYQIVAGERRWRAAQRAKLTQVPVIVREFDDAETLEVALLENIQRQDLNAIEEAEGYRRLIGEYGHSQEALGKLVHKSRSHVANLLRLLDLPDAVRERPVMLVRGGPPGAGGTAVPEGVFQIRVGTPLADVESRLLEETLRLNHGNKTLTAKMLGIDPKTVFRKLKQGEAEDVTP